MNTGQPSTRRTARLRSLAVAGVLLALGATACSGSDTPGAADPTTTAPNAKLASTALSAGLKAFAAGNMTEASKQYNLVLDYDATNKFAFYNLALIDAAAGNYGLAEDKYRLALKSDAKFDPALFNLAILRTARNDPDEAISLYQRAVAADKTDAAAWLNLGLLLRANGQVPLGNADVLHAIALDDSLTDPAKATGASTTTP